MTVVPLHFNFLGDRKYIDMSSIVSSFWRGIGQGHRSQFSNLSFKLNHPILCEGYLHYDTLKNFQVPTDAQSFADVSWTYDGKQFKGCIITSAIKVTKRIPEPVFDIKQHCEISEGKLKLKNSFSDNSGYILMKIGKYLIAQKHDPKVKVVKFSFKNFFTAEQMVGMEMTLENVRSSPFLKLVCKKNGELFGEIIVLGNAAP